MGPHGLVQAYLHRPAAATPRQAHRRTRPDPGPPGKTPGCANAEVTTASAHPAPARTTTFPSPTASSSPSFTCATSSRTPPSPRCTTSAAPPSPAPSMRSAPCSQPAGSPYPHRPDLRLRTLADVFAYASSCGVELRLDGTEVQVRRPRASKPGRQAFVSGKKKMNTKKATVVTDGEGRTLWAGAFRPGRMHDQTAVRTEGIADLFTQFPQVKAKVDAGYRGLAKEFPDQVQAPPLKPKKDAPPGGGRGLGRSPSQAVITADLRRARQRRAQAMADPPEIPRTPRELRRNLHRHRRPGLRPRRRAVTHPSQPARPARPTANRAPRRKR